VVLKALNLKMRSNSDKEASSSSTQRILILSGRIRGIVFFFSEESISDMAHLTKMDSEDTPRNVNTSFETLLI